jgi:hypothetical protein
VTSEGLEQRPAKPFLIQRPSHPNLKVDAPWLHGRVEDVDRLVDDIEWDGTAILPG